MKITKTNPKFIFSGDNDLDKLRAVMKFVGQTSNDERLKAGLTEEESELVHQFFTMLVDEIK